MKRRRESASSLELLLDTICNTFGGVLFLAILVCVMLRGAPRLKTLAASPSAESVAMQSRLAALAGERDVLQASLRQRMRLQNRFSDAATEAAWQERETLNARLAGMLRARDEVLQATSKLEQAAAAAEVASAEKELATAAAEAANARRALQVEVAARTQVARLPREHFTAKREIGMVIRFGRLYQWVKYDAYGLQDGLNTDEFVIVEERAGEMVTMPKPYSGVPIVPDQVPNLRAKLAKLDPTTRYVALAIWGDSFVQFPLLKSLLVERGLEYRLLPVAEGDPIFSQGGRGGKVQ